MPVRDALPYVGSCFGYSLYSGEPMLYARTHHGSPLWLPLGEVPPVDQAATPLMTLRAPTDDRSVTGLVYQDGDGRYTVWLDGSGWYHVDVPGHVVTLPASTSPVAREEGLWSVPGRILLVERGDLPLHAAAIEIDGRALILAGPTRAGKTTLAASFAAAGFRLLSEDLVDVQFAPEPVVLPGPTYLRLRSDMADVVQVPGSQRVATSPGRTHLQIADRSPSTGSGVSVGAVILLRVGTDDDIVLEPADPAQGVRDLWSQGFAMPTAESRSQSFSNICGLLEAVPLFDLTRPLRMQAVPRVIDALVSVVRAHA